MVDLICGDCVKIPLADGSVDMVFGSPPYEAARTYGIGFNLKGDAWVEWAVERFVECLRVSRGLVAWVVDGTTPKWCRYSLAPERLQVRLADMGVAVRAPMTYKRYGVPNGGGASKMPRRITETIIVATREPRPPAWADLRACGAEPVCKSAGGHTSNRIRDGRRVPGRRIQPERSILTSVIDCGALGGGNMGHTLAHENEAPFALKLAEIMVQTYCPPGGTVLDPFSGSGTTAHAALLHGRNAVGMDIRESQIELTRKRLADVEQANQEN